MLKHFLRRAAPWAHAPLLGVAASCAWLAGMPAAQAADTTAPGQSVPSPFAHYRSWRDEPMQDWREANERVGRIGGWRTYLRESQPAGASADQNGNDHHAH